MLGFLFEEVISKFSDSNLFSTDVIGSGNGIM